MLTIGQFSKTCMVTVKALRHYDKIGLIKPQYIDRQTGYRCYEESQIPLMLSITRLKRYGFALSEIKEILSETDKRALFSKLQNQKKILELQMAETRGIVAEIERHLQNFERTGDIMSYQAKYEISLEQTAPKAVISTRQMMSIAEFGKYYGQLFERAAKKGIKLTYETMAIYHDKEFDEDWSDIEVAVGAENGEGADRIIDGGLCAVTIHKGGYSNLSEAYAALSSWIKENGYEITAAPYEIYIKNQYDKIPPEQWETKIFFPVKK